MFQSWDDEMQEHCHLHFIVTAGGLNPEGRWTEADGDFLLPTGVLSAKFRGKFLAYLREWFNAVSARGEVKAARAGAGGACWDERATMSQSAQQTWADEVACGYRAGLRACQRRV